MRLYVTCYQNVCLTAVILATTRNFKNKNKCFNLKSQQTDK